MPTANDSTTSAQSTVDASTMVNIVMMCHTKVAVRLNTLFDRLKLQHPSMQMGIVEML